MKMNEVYNKTSEFPMDEIKKIKHYEKTGMVQIFFMNKTTAIFKPTYNQIYKFKKHSNYKFIKAFK